MALAQAERTDLAEYLGDLDLSQWDAPSLCVGWSVRDVVAHMASSDDVGAGGLVARFWKGRFVPDRINAVGVREHRSRSVTDLVAALRTNSRPQGLTAASGGAVGLTDTLIHHRDIRLALGHHRDIPAKRVRAALRFAVIAPPIRVARTARGLRVVANDLDWKFGRGRAVEGRGQALLMAVAGRAATVDELHGPGVPVLRTRLG